MSEDPKPYALMTALDRKPSKYLEKLCFKLTLTLFEAFHNVNTNIVFIKKAYFR